MSNALQSAIHTRDLLKRWLLEHAYQVWWARGADRVRGGFHERLHLDGSPTEEPRRARVHPRQLYSYSIADDLGWAGPAEQAVQHALDFFLAHYRRGDGLFRSLVAADGTAVSDQAVLYDQAFALLGFAAAYDTLSDDVLRDEARAALRSMRERFGRDGAGFEESHPPMEPLLSNSHMHLLEAALAWMELDPEPLWQQLAGELVELALQVFIDPKSGFILEFFDRQWRPMPGEDGRIVEPGHQYEWAWLLLRWHRHRPQDRIATAALRLIELAESYGVDRKRQVAINRLLVDHTVSDAQARLWPQTERIKAACIAAELTGEARYWQIADEAGGALRKYFDTPMPGLWYDKLTTGGDFVAEPAPASSFYHIVCAIQELDCSTQRVLSARVDG